MIISSEKCKVEFFDQPEYVTNQSDQIKNILNLFLDFFDIHKLDLEDNVLKNSPHTMSMVINSDWQRSYSVEKAVFPLEFVRKNKFWPTVRRVDDAFGDRNLHCTCAPISDYIE